MDTKVLELARALRPTRCPGSGLPVPASLSAAICHCGQLFPKPLLAAAEIRTWDLPEHDGVGR